MLAQSSSVTDEAQEKESGVYDLVRIDTRKRQIRLLDLEPGKRGLELKGTLRSAVLQHLEPHQTRESHVQRRSHNAPSLPQYEALSYTWGGSRHGRMICLNNKYTLPITDNLYNALQRLRRRKTIRTLWIDALCIDQSTRVERSQLVQFMGDIYASASSVNVWLGEPGQWRDFNALLMEVRIFRKLWAGREDWIEQHGRNIPGYARNHHRYLQVSPLAVYPRPACQPLHTTSLDGTPEYG
jgi:hypothetical protein